MKTQLIQAVLFDLDQTLVDFMKMKRVSCKAAISAMIQSGLSLKEKKAEKILFELYDQYGIEDPLIFQRFLRKINRKIDYRLLAKAVAAYRKAQPKVLQPYPHTRKTLAALKRKGIILGVVSDAPRMKAWLRLAEMNLSDYFDIVVALDDTKKLKPHPAPFRKAIQKLKISPEQILFVGDNPDRDIAGAHAVGMQTCLAKYGHLKKNHSKNYFKKTKQQDRIKPDRQITSIRALQRFF